MSFTTDGVMTPSEIHQIPEIGTTGCPQGKTITTITTPLAAKSYLGLQLIVKFGFMYICLELIN